MSDFNFKGRQGEINILFAGIDSVTNELIFWLASFAKVILGGFFFFSLGGGGGGGGETPRAFFFSPDSSWSVK